MSDDKVDESLLETDNESDEHEDWSSSSSDNEEEEMDGEYPCDREGEADDEDDGENGAEGMDADEANGDGENGGENGHQLKRKTYIPGDDGSADPDELEFDESAYVMYHKAECGYPCLSFDVIPDSLGTDESRAKAYPQTVYLVAGTQAPKVHANKLLVMKMSNLTRMKKKKRNDEEEEESSDSDDEDGGGKDDPKLLAAQIPHDGSVNRVRTITLGTTQVAASWSETGKVSIWDLTKQLQAVEDQKTNDLFNKLKNLPKPIYSYRGHKQEGFAMDWSTVAKGYLATGDCSRRIHIWKPLEAFSWHVEQHPLSGHTDSVEDIQWSPNEAHMLVSCSVDKSLRVWDIRSPQSKANVLTVEESHDADVNVISWNRLETAILLSGGDDGVIKTWDMRMFGKPGRKPSPIAMFKHHIAPITSIEWHPTDNSVFAASGDDNQITLWDLAVEKDDVEEKKDGDKDAGPSKEEEDEEDKERLEKLPPQLLFIHQGSNEVKELHWHKQIPGLVISTALSGFDVFRTISV